MPSLVSEAVSLAESALSVAAVAVPVGALCAVFARRFGEPVLPAYRKGASRWHGLDVLVLAFACLFLREAIAQTVWPAPDGELPKPERFRILHERSTLVGLVLLPVAAVAFWNWKRASAAEPARSGRSEAKRFVADVALGSLAWSALAPLVFGVHFLVNAALDALAMAPDDHPLKHLKIETARDAIVLVVGACLVAPVFEEMGCRRLMVPWAARKLIRSWIVLAVAGLASIAYATGGSRSGPPILVGIAAGAVAAMALAARRWPRLPLRPAAAILSTATLFAVIHSGVWPTPIPLLVLGLGLGWLVLRTKTATAAIAAHALFNAISVVAMLRGGP